MGRGPTAPYRCSLEVRVDPLSRPGDRRHSGRAGRAHALGLLTQRDGYAVEQLRLRRRVLNVGTRTDHKQEQAQRQSHQSPFPPAITKSFGHGLPQL